MLKITIHDSPEALTFQLEGKLVGAWAREVEQSWATASTISSRRALIVDLAGITFIDNEGKRVLSHLCREGALFKASAPLTRCIVDEVTGEQKKRSATSLLTHVLALLIVIGIASSAAQIESARSEVDVAKVAVDLVHATGQMEPLYAQ